MWAYRSERAGVIPDRFTGHHVSAVRQERWDRLEPHPTDMPILNDAGAAAYPRELIAGRLERKQITMTSLLTGHSFGQPHRRPVGAAHWSGSPGRCSGNPCSLIKGSSRR